MLLKTNPSDAVKKRKHIFKDLVKSLEGSEKIYNEKNEKQGECNFEMN